MRKHIEIFDETYFLNEHGKRLIRLALQDINESMNLFSRIREALTENR